MHLQLAQTDVEIARCFPIMMQLLPNLQEEDFVARIKHLMNMNYRLAFLDDNAKVCSVAGFRIVEMLLANRPYLFFDEIVTDKDKRSQG